MNAGAVIVGLLFVLVYGTLAILAWRRKLLARLALREVLRRPIQSAFVVAGLMVGTSMILMSFINADSMSVSLSQATYESWGRVDLLVGANGRFFQPDVAKQLGNSEALNRRVRAVQAGVELWGEAADLEQKLDSPNVRFVGFDPATQAAFGAFALSDGRNVDGHELAADEVLLTQSLAESVQARAGDRVQVAIAGFAPVVFKVFGVARPVGPGDYGAQPAIFATLSTSAVLTGSDQINVVRISAPGQGQEELENGKRVAPAVAALLRDFAPGLDLQVRTSKADDVKEIVDLAAQNEPANFVLSSVVLLAGIALVVNLALALAEERRPHLAVLRALGLSRAGLVITAAIEGGVYSLGAAAVAAIPGIAAGWLLVSNAGRWVPEIHEKSATVLFVVSPQALATSVAGGAVLTIATLLLAAVRTTRLTVASAVRSLPDPPAVSGRRRLRSTAAIAVIPVGAIAAASGVSPLRLIGGFAVIAALGYLLRGYLSGRARATIVGCAVLVWAFAVYSTFSLDDLETDLWLTFLTLAFSIAALSMLVAANMRSIEGVIPPSLVGYLTRREPRLALSAGALGLVLAMVAFIGTFLSSTNPDYRKDASGYDVAVTSLSAPSLSLPTRLASDVDSQMAVATAAYFGPVRSTTSDRGPGPLEWHQQVLTLYQLDDDQLTRGGLSLASRESRFASDAAVWGALRDNPGLVVSGTYVPGTIVYVLGSHGPVGLEVVGSFRLGFFEGLMGSSAALAPLSSEQPGTTLLLRLRPGVDAREFAVDVRRSLFPSGVQAATTQDLLDQGGASLRNFASEMEALMIAAVAVGVLSLGVLALRAVIERRRALGLLRALGNQPPQLVVGMIGESLLAAAAGVVVGVVSGSGIGYFFMSQYYTGTGVKLPLDALAFAVTLALLTALAVTAGPALAAARTAPAQALRLID